VEFELLAVQTPCASKKDHYFFCRHTDIAVHPKMICFPHCICRVKKSLTKGNIAGSDNIPDAASLNADNGELFD
jgi:hypothetical protein